MVFIALISFLRYSCIACEPPTPLISQLHLPVLLFFSFPSFFLFFSFSLSLSVSPPPLPPTSPSYHHHSPTLSTCPRSHLVAVHGFSCGAFLPSLFTRTHTPITIARTGPTKYFSMASRTTAHVLFSIRCRCLVQAHFIRVHTWNVTIGLLFMLVVSHDQWRSIP